jgi:DNA-binding response OmpR family regulator
VTVVATRVLVDDEEGAALTLRLILDCEGYAVEVAASVAEAARQIAAARYDAILLDMTVGADSGLTVLARLRETSPDSVGSDWLKH